MVGGHRGSPYLSKLLSEDKPRGRVNNPCVQSRGVDEGGIRGPEMLGVLERSHWTHRCRSRVDLDLARAFGHSPKSSGLPHQNLRQGRNFNPLDRVQFPGPREVRSLCQDAVLGFQTIQQ